MAILQALNDGFLISPLLNQNPSSMYTTSLTRSNFTCYSGGNAIGGGSDTYNEEM
jgi:hypothetical protein